MNLNQIMENVTDLSPAERYFKKVKMKYGLKFDVLDKVLNIRVKKSERPLLQVLGAYVDIQYGDMIVFKVLKRRVEKKFDSCLVQYNGDPDTVVMRIDSVLRNIVKVKYGKR